MRLWSPAAAVAHKYPLVMQLFVGCALLLASMILGIYVRIAYRENGVRFGRGAPTYADRKANPRAYWLILSLQTLLTLAMFAGALLAFDGDRVLDEILALLFVAIVAFPPRWMSASAKRRSGT